MFLIHNYILLRSYQYQVNLSDNETLVRVMIDDMEALDGLSGSSDDGNIQSQLFALNTDVLGQIAMFLKPADVFSLSLTCKHFKENGKLIWER